MHKRPTLVQFISAALVAGAIASFVFLATLGAPGCNLVQTAIGGEEAVADLEAMSDAEWITWRTETVLQAKIVAQAAVEEGAVEPGDLEAIASVLTVIGGSNAVEAGAIAEWLDLSGYKAALLQLAILELDGKLVAGGSYADGILSERGKELFVHLGAAFQEAAVGV